jgi:uncharacterized protein YcaQ
VAALHRLGAIQLDSVNVLARSHELIPFARMGACSLEAMRTAVYAERQGFEYWGHEASWLPIESYRYFLPRMARMREQTRGWWRQVREEHAALYPLVLERVRAEGPLGAAAFEDPRGSRGIWWDWKPAKLVLEDLLDRGELMCTHRTSGFARLYDLPERVLPPGLDVSDPGPAEAARYLLRRGFQALGLGTAIEAADYFRLKPEQWRPAFADLLEAGDVVPVQVEGWRGAAYAVPEALEGPTDLPEHSPTFLSPFDNLVWERGRTERLFDFRYRLEIYVPEPKRQYGYYVLPLLARGTLAGRADLKLDRPTRTLRVRGLWLEGAEPAEVALALTDLGTHLGAVKITVERSSPRGTLSAVRRALRDVHRGVLTTVNVAPVT